MNVLISFAKCVLDRFKSFNRFQTDMKIYAFVDVHGRKRIIDEIIETAKREKPDIIIDAGDISNFGKGLKEGLERLDTLGVPVLILHGNHESEEQMNEMCQNFANVIFMHKGLFELDNYAFFGYGGGGFSRKDDVFERISKIVIKKIKGKKLIFFSHAPIFKTKTDYIRGKHLGNESYRKFIEETKPKLVICGHFHETAKMTDDISGSLVVNPGPYGLIFNFKD